MSQKKNNGRAVTIDLGDDDENDDFQSNDDFENMETVHNLTLADLLGQSNRRREEIYNFTIDLDDADDDIDFWSYGVEDLKKISLAGYQAHHSQTPW